MQPADGGSTTAWDAGQPVLPAPLVAVGGARGRVPAAGQGDDAAPGRRGRPLALLALARPRQWVKNALVIAAAGAAGALGQDDVLGRVLVACGAFCLISAGIYALNDVHDRDEDRLHPRKCRRPLASGELSVRAAVAFAAVCLTTGLSACVFISPPLALVGLGYFALTLTYSWVWRHIVVLDLVALAGGFVLRAVAGGVAAPVGLSRWFVLVVTFTAIFVAAGKRHAELTRVNGSGAGARRVLHRYTPSGLRRILAASGAGALFAYCVWAFELPDVGGVPWRLLTVIPFTACLLRYAALVRSGVGEAPEDVVLSDRLVAGGGLAWLVLFTISVNVAG